MKASRLGYLFLLAITMATAGIAIARTVSAATDPLKFTPEIPIPGLFDQTVTIDSTTIAQYIRVIFIFFIWVVGIVATVMVVYGGIKWVAAAGNPSRINDARDVINSAIIGVIIALSSVVLLNIINPGLTAFKGISLSYVSKLLFEERNSSPERSGTTVSTSDFPAIAARVKAHPDWVTAIKSNATSQVPAARILAIIFIESSGNPSAFAQAKGKEPAYGLMQIQAATAKPYVGSGADLYNPILNIKAGSSYLKYLFAHACVAPTAACPNGQACKNGDYTYINAAYNGGPGANKCSADAACAGQTIAQCIGNLGYAETRNYILKADAAYQWILSNNFFNS